MSTFVYPNEHLEMRQGARIILKSKEQTGSDLGVVGEASDKSNFKGDYPGLQQSGERGYLRNGDWRMLKLIAGLVSAALLLVFVTEIRRASESPHPSVHHNSAQTKNTPAHDQPANEGSDNALAIYTYWLTFFTAILAAATLGLGTATLGLYFAGERQLKLAKETGERQSIEIQNQIEVAQIGAKAAQEAADAAKLNAEAVMAAEGAHLFPVVKSDNLKDVLKGARWYGETAPKEGRLTTPSLDYCLKNYGKTPAILHSVMHGMHVFDKPSTSRTMHNADDLPLEINAGEREGGEFTVELSAVFTMAMGNAVLEYRSELLFFGQARFKDFFDRQFLCFWEFDGRGGGFKLIKYEERPDPDKKI